MKLVVLHHVPRALDSTTPRQQDRNTATQQHSNTANRVTSVSLEESVDWDAQQTNRTVAWAHARRYSTVGESEKE
jgi:hypothetical protein